MIERHRQRPRLLCVKRSHQLCTCPHVMTCRALDDVYECPEHVTVRSVCSGEIILEVGYQRVLWRGSVWTSSQYMLDNDAFCAEVVLL